MAAGVALLVNENVSAATVLSNLGQPSSGTAFIGTNNPPTGANLMRGETFTTGTNAQGYQLNSVTLEMSAANGNGLGDFVLELRSTDSFQRPLTAIGSFLVTANPVTAGQYTYQFADPNLVMAPSTRYALVARSPTSTGTTASQYAWPNTFGSGQAAPGWSFGGPWSGQEGSTSWAPLRNGPQKYALDVTAIPEPESLWLVGGAAILLATRRGGTL